MPSCTQCGSTFQISTEDLAFYDAISPTFAGKKYSLPPPTQCPDCRYQQRLTWRNERSLHKRKCSATGKDIVSIFSADKQWPPVYEQSYWWSDKWDAKTYGKDIDFNRPFFEQWAELFRATPQLAMNNQMSENCEYTNQSQKNKDCYMIFCSNDTRDCLYGMWLQKCMNCSDASYLEESELSHEILNGSNCYRCTFSQNLQNCSDVSFSRDCIGCQNCFGCINLRNKEHCYFNEQLSKEEYEQRVQTLQIDKHSSVVAARKNSDSFFEKFPRKYYTGTNNEKFSGDYLLNLRDTLNCFNCRGTEHLQHCQDVWRARNCQDMTETVENDFCYSLEGSGFSSNTLFSKKFCDLSNSLYCSHCNFSKNLFGCISLNHAQYCILNKQYSKEEYERLAGKLIEHMQKTSEWGKHFPSQFSPFGYNETVAQEYFPLTRDNALAKGYKWRDGDDAAPAVQRVVGATDLPDSINDIPDDIVNWGIRCEATGRPFRVIKQELELLRTLRVPVPRLHPDERYRQRMALRNPRKLWQRPCDECSKEMTTTYAPEKPETVLCEECYRKAVY